MRVLRRSAALRPRHVSLGWCVASKHYAASKSRRRHDAGSRQRRGPRGRRHAPVRAPPVPKLQAEEEEEGPVETLYGVNAVLSAIRAGRRRVLQVLVAEGERGDPASRKLTHVAEQAVAAGAPVVLVSRPELSAACGNRATVVHQGVVARVTPLPRQMLSSLPPLEAPVPLQQQQQQQQPQVVVEQLEDMTSPWSRVDHLKQALSSADAQREALQRWLQDDDPDEDDGGREVEEAAVEGEQQRGAAGLEGRGPHAPLWLALDQLWDPQNVGAVLRSAHFLGVAGVIVPHRGSCHVNPTVSHVSAGAAEWIQVWHTACLAQLCREARQGPWSVVVASAGQTHGSLAPTLTARDAGPALVHSPTLLVLGNEGSGVSRDVIATASHFITIPGRDTQHSGVDSLNVGSAASVLIHALVAG